MCDAEREANVFLKSLLEGGILHNYDNRSPAEVLCVPQQIFLEESGLAPYLLLPSTPAGAVLRARNSGASSVALTEDQHKRIAGILQNQFLYYHLVHFDTVASTTFTTLRGHRGTFANTLDSVSRFGRIGASRVLCNMEPLIEYKDSYSDDDGDDDDYDTDESGHACKMNIYVIEKPLMDEDEMHNTLSALERVVFPLHGETKFFSQGEEMQRSQQQQQQKRPQCEGDSMEDILSSKEIKSNYRQAAIADNDVGFDEFQEYMKMSVCVPLVQTISIFVDKTQKNETLLKDNRAVRQVTQHCMKQCSHTSFFSNDSWKMRVAAEGFEKYIMTKLYWHAFDVDPEERRRGAELHNKLQQLNDFVTADQLEALPDVESHKLWKLAMVDLAAMNLFKSPRDKLRCAVRASMKLTEAVESALVSRGKKKSTSGVAGDSKTLNAGFGADEFLPCFILLVLRAVPRNYYSNVCYIVKFRDGKLCSQEESYCLTSLESAAEFWLKYSPDPLLGNEAQTASEMHPSKTKDARTMPVSVDELFSLPSATGGEPGVHTKSNDAEKKVDDGLQQPPRTLSENSIASLDWTASANASPLDVNENERRNGVVRMLLRENKAFEDLSVGELRVIVEEARASLLSNDV